MPTVERTDLRWHWKCPICGEKCNWPLGAKAHLISEHTLPDAISGIGGYRFGTRRWGWSEGQSASLYARAISYIRSMLVFWGDKTRQMSMYCPYCRGGDFIAFFRTSDDLKNHLSVVHKVY